MFNWWSQWWSPLSIKEDIIYKKRNDLKNFKSKRPESIFVEAITPSTKKHYCRMHISPPLYGTNRGDSKHFPPMRNVGKKLNLELSFRTQSQMWYFLVLISISCLYFIELSLEKYSRPADLSVLNPRKLDLYDKTVVILSA